MTEKTTTTPSRPSARGPRPGGPGGARRPRSDGKTFADRVKDIDQKIIDIRRVTRVVSGGRRMSFAVSMIIGDKTGILGVGTGKANDTALAITKALKDAKKNAIKLKLTKTGSIPFDVDAKYCSSRIMLFPNKGKGLVAGAAIRDMFLLAGVKDVTGKVLSGSKNKLNTARATLKALARVSTPYKFGPTGSTSTPEFVATVEEAVPPTV